MLLPREPACGLAGRLGHKFRADATHWVAIIGAPSCGHQAQALGHFIERVRRQADRWKTMEPDTANNQSTTHAPARTKGRPTPTDNHEPNGHMDAEGTGTTKPRQARLVHNGGDALGSGEATRRQK